MKRNEGKEKKSRSGNAKVPSNILAQRMSGRLKKYEPLEMRAVLCVVLNLGFSANKNVRTNSLYKAVFILHKASFLKQKKHSLLRKKYPCFEKFTTKRICKHVT